MFPKILTQIFGSRNERLLKGYRRTVAQINALEPQFEALDDAALKVATIYRFSPALNRDKKVPVWVSFPITFQVR